MWPDGVTRALLFSRLALRARPLWAEERQRDPEDQVGEAGRQPRRAAVQDFAVEQLVDPTRSETAVIPSKRSAIAP